MPNTPIEIEAGVGTAKVLLAAMDGATGTPAASYAAGEVIAGVVYSTTVPESLHGLFRYHAYTADDNLTGSGRIRLADTTEKQVTGDDRPIVFTDALQSILIPGQVVRWRITYEEQVEDPGWVLFANGSLLSAGTTTGVGTEFTHVVTIPAGVDDGAAIKVQTDESVPRMFIAGVVFNLETSIEAEGFAQVLPGRVTAEERQQGTTLVDFVGERSLRTLTMLQSDGKTPLDMTGKSYRLVWETPDGKDVAVIEQGSTTLTGDDNNLIRYSIPAEVSKVVREGDRALKWSVVDPNTPFTVFGFGKQIIRYVARKTT